MVFYNDIRSLTERVIYLRYDIALTCDDIRLRRMNGTDIISYLSEAKIYHTAYAVYHIAFGRYIIKIYWEKIYYKTAYYEQLTTDKNDRHIICGGHLFVTGLSVLPRR